jgi:hypothetical protein
MRTFRSLLPTVVIIAALAGTPALAGSFYFGGHGGLSFYSLNDLNDEIDAINSVAGADYLDNVTKGFDYGLQIGFQASPAVTLGVGYSRLNGNSKYTEAGGSIEYDVPANVFEAHVTYLPPSPKTVRFGFGGNVGMISSAGSIDLSVSGEEPIRGDFSGSGLLVAGFAAMDWSLSESVAVFGNAGYRYASIGSFDVEDIKVTKPDGSDYALDYNGVFLRVGLKVSPN